MDRYMTFPTADAASREGGAAAKAAQGTYRRLVAHIVARHQGAQATGKRFIYSLMEME
jgi:hypothetical protein